MITEGTEMGLVNGLDQTGADLDNHHFRGRRGGWFQDVDGWRNNLAE